MRGTNLRSWRNLSSFLALTLSLAGVSFWAAPSATSQTYAPQTYAPRTAAPSQEPGQIASPNRPPVRPDSAPPVPHYRLLSYKEGSKIVRAAWTRDPDNADAQDCSHVVNAIYRVAGYDYPYASSFDLYRGMPSFVLVRHPQPGDLIAWPGHVGIVLSARKHSFYSLVSTGLEAQTYYGRYWRGRGHPRFYRFLVRATPAPLSSQVHSTGHSPSSE